MKKLLAITTAAVLAQSATVMAAPLAIYPVQTGAELVRYKLGQPILTANSASGSVQIMPRGFDHGYLAFGVAVLNQSGSPANFGMENVSVSSQGQQLALFTRTQLENKAKNRAMWAQIGTQLVTNLGAHAAAQEHNTYVSRVSVGNVSAVGVYKDYTPGTVAAGNVWAQGMEASAAIQARLDNTLDHLAQDTLQTTTVDPGSDYAGLVEVADSGKLKLPYDIHVTVNWNGTQYPFTFRVTKEGQNVPPPFTTTPATLAAFAPKAPIASPAPLAQSYRPVSYAAQTPAPQPAAMSDLSPYEQGRLAAAAQLAANGQADNQ